MHLKVLRSRDSVDDSPWKSSWPHALKPLDHNSMARKTVAALLLRALIQRLFDVSSAQPRCGQFVNGCAAPLSVSELLLS
jgi:hypothetical protein